MVVIAIFRVIKAPFIDGNLSIIDCYAEAVHVFRNFVHVIKNRLVGAPVHVIEKTVHVHENCCSRVLRILKWVHSGINNVTPESRFKGYDGCIQDHRRLVLLQARERNRNRWISGVVRQFQMAGSQFLNPDRPSRLSGSSPEGLLMEGTRNSGEQAVHWPKAA